MYLVSANDTARAGHAVDVHTLDVAEVVGDLLGAADDPALMAYSSSPCCCCCSRSPLGVFVGRELLMLQRRRAEETGVWRIVVLPAVVLNVPPPAAELEQEEGVWGWGGR